MINIVSIIPYCFIYQIIYYEFLVFNLSSAMYTNLFSISIYTLFLLLLSIIFSTSELESLISDNFECGFYSLLTLTMRYKLAILGIFYLFYFKHFNSLSSWNLCIEFVICYFLFLFIPIYPSIQSSNMVLDPQLIITFMIVRF